MKLHGNAKTCPHSRRLICERVLGEGWSVARAAAAAGVSERTAAKWLARYRAEGDAGLSDRSSAPARVPSRTSQERVAVIAALRRLRMTAAEIAEVLSMPLSTVSLILLRIGLGKRSRLEPLEPPNRYEKARPGELLHIDVKKLARIARPGHRIHGDRSTRVQGVGWEYVHVCVDDATRLAYVELLPDERTTTAIAFLRRAVAHFAAFGIRVEGLLTDG
ncbi:MAG TPA: leucine zipper domain-containing protein [Gemmatimonadales bacterium]|nr:leucine zipper domain-containing protein [Gemmatimonadales bacterium]